MIKIEIFSGSGFKFDRELLRKEIEETVARNSELTNVEVCVSIVGERKMKLLHKKYMETEEVTDVLSFPLEENSMPDFVRVPDGITRLGDIVICYSVAVQQAGPGGRSVDQEIAFLAGHGCLHLLGIHHE
jgi:probable rRNA maturation factor